MTFKLSLDGVEPWKGGGLILRQGTHPVKVVKEEINEPGKDGYEGDHPVVIVTLVAIGGEERGCEIRDWIHVTENSLGRVAQIYDAFQVDVPSGEFNWISLMGRQAKALVREKPGRRDPSQKFSEVASYTPLDGTEAAQAGIEDAFDAKSVDDDRDIPF